jgi:hypothetical protein
MRTEAEIRMTGMHALIDALGLVETERFLISINREPFNYTEWRRHGLPVYPLEELARLANLESQRIDDKQ